MISIINYGMGNLHSVSKAFNRINVETKIVETKEEILSADKLVLPGVGHFKKAMMRLEQLDIIEALNHKVQVEKTPILGICLGAQLFTSYSEEGNVDGLNWIKAKTIKFPQFQDSKLKVPHMGWNQLKINLHRHSFLDNISKEDFFYFVHSFYISCDGPENKMANTEYGLEFDSIIVNENIIGVQFHPEKSHSAGLKMLKNFSLSHKLCSDPE